jgi:hypothetical protein
MPKNKKKTTRKKVDYKKKYGQMAVLMLATLKTAATLNPALRILSLPAFPVKELVAAVKEIHKGVE